MAKHIFLCRQVYMEILIIFVAVLLQEGEGVPGRWNEEDWFEEDYSEMGKQKEKYETQNQEIDCPYCPYFLSTSTTVTTSRGIRANLTCGVQNVGDRKVSWIRRRDLHVLSVGGLTYTNDKRFVAAHVPGTPYWTLLLHRPTPRDSGVYECQVATMPKISRKFEL
ncbi:unnamed protein product, partial [Meganyctiphanes norvegica]